MSLIHGIMVGLKEMWAHKMRSFLTMLGVILGVAALAAMFAFMEGMIADMEKFIRETGGVERVTCSSDQIPEDQMPFSGLNRQRRMKDIQALMYNIPEIDEYSPEVTLGRDYPVQYMNKTVRVEVRGVTVGELALRNYEVEKGRFICDLDRVERQRVCVLGTYPADELFGQYGDPLGRKIRIGGKNFRVVGVLKHYVAGQGGQNWMNWKNRIVFIPMETTWTVFTHNKDIPALDIQVKDTSKVAEISQRAQQVLFHTHRHISCLQMRTNEEMVQNFSDRTAAFNITLGIVASISMLVGGIGIMNIMLASLNERIREIGIRKAIGARNIDILSQVIVEAVLLSVLGGVLGVGVSLLLTKFITFFVKENLSAPIVKPEQLLFAFSVSVVVGIVFGIFPAFKAASLDPIEALRHE